VSSATSMAQASDLVDIPFEVRAEEQGARLDVFLSKRIKRMSRSLAATLIRSGMVRRDGDPAALKPASRVQSGDRILLKRKKLNEPPTDDIVVPVLYEDRRMLAVSKPGDLVVHPTASAYHRTLIRILWTRLGDTYLDLAHRIDKETSGLVLIARDPEASANLKGQFASRRVKKAYLAVVSGAIDADELVLDRPMRLKPNSDSGVLMEIGGDNAQPAITEIAVLARSPRASLVEARPHTGRQHQIRLHLADAGHPIIGDKLYLGGEDLFIRALNHEAGAEEILAKVGHSRQALHAQRAAFAHPETNAPMTLEAPPPPDLLELMDALGLEWPPR
jgi:23S rRNA pseudouridine1911/1915/1917 synthase